MTTAPAKKTAGKRPGRATDPLTAILTEVRTHARAISSLPASLVGGAVPERGCDAYHHRADGWSQINHRRAEKGHLGLDGLVIEATFATFAEIDELGEPVSDSVRRGLLNLASLAVAAVARIDGGSE